MQTSLFTLSAALVLMAPIASAHAQGARGAMAACRTDAATFCQSVEAGGGRRIACLKENRAKLSPDCAAAVDARSAVRDERRAAGLGVGAANQSNAAVGAPAGSPPVPSAPVLSGPQAQAPATPAALAEKQTGRARIAACRADVATHCQTADKGGGRMKCLMQNEAKLSPDCKAAIGEIASRGQALRQACRADAQSLCANVERSGGKIVKCLKDNQAKLSPTCGQAIDAMPARRG